MNVKPLALSNPLSFVTTPVMAPGQRRRIWQIDAGMHCSVLGTCLTLGDLHALARRARYDVPPKTSAYELHSWFVDMMAYSNDVSKIVDKTLEKRHSAAAREILRARTEEELETIWKKATADGNIVGPYWGAMMHPLATTPVQWRLFGDIHMLSHLVGASRRSDVGRLHHLEEHCADLDGKLAHQKHFTRVSLKDKQHAEEALEMKQHDLERSRHRLAAAQKRIAALETTGHTSALEARVAELERQLEATRAREAAATESLAEANARVEEVRADQELTHDRIRELTAENEALERELETSVVCPFAEAGTGVGSGLAIGDEPSDLTGKRILCVGGRSNLVQHYRALVERRGGELVHHDGGLEESLDAVTRALATIDLVVCPIDCVSHAATIKVKRACKNMAKQFVPLRSSGLSSFARFLQSFPASVQ